MGCVMEYARAEEDYVMKMEGKYVKERKNAQGYTAR